MPVLLVVVWQTQTVYVVQLNQNVVDDICFNSFVASVLAIYCRGSQILDIALLLIVLII